MSLFLVPRRRPLSLYDSVSEGSAAVVIREYSSSFGMASRLLVEPVRTQIRNVYALVRVADEIVDHPDAGLDPAVREMMLDRLHDDVGQALQTGYSANLVVHAFARTALSCGIGRELVDPFFASMRRDLESAAHDAASLERYIYGSAEVVGLMCLRAFLAEEPADGQRGQDLEAGARRLGAAFQKLNFLRDLAVDHDVLGRRYFPGLDPDRFTDADRDRILDDIAADLDAAAVVLPELPASSRRAVRAAHATFTELACRLRTTPAAEIRRTRVRVPAAVKLRLAARALYGARS
jgi:phytoene/squalene synthetase